MRNLGESSKKLDLGKVFANLALVERQSPFPPTPTMKANRLLESPDFKTNSSKFHGMSSQPRGFVIHQQPKKSPAKIEDKISSMRSDYFVDEIEDDFRLEDEFSAEEISKVIAGCREKMVGTRMTSENWNQIGEYLADELWKLSRLKEDLSLVERKCGMVHQKVRELSQKSPMEVSKTRSMACAMLLAETEMRRDHLKTRISSIVDSFVGLILSEFDGRASHHEREIRLRAVFASL